MTTDIHTMFGLSGSNYLVLQRTLLQSMPLEWQHRFTEAVGELTKAFSHIEEAEAYEVIPGRELEISDLNEGEHFQAGITVTVDEHEDGGYKVTYHDRGGQEMAGHEMVFLPLLKDPIPHYNRGRTRIEPKLS